MGEVLLGVLVGVLVAIPVGLMIQARRRRDGLVECALLAEDQFPGLPASKWRHGAATAQPGVLRFRPGGPVGMRFPRGTPFDIPVLSARVEEGRHPPLTQVWSINPTLAVARLQTPHGELALAAPARPLSGVVTALQRPSGSTREPGGEADNPS
jgi:hypothetical protein